MNTPLSIRQHSCASCHIYKDKGRHLVVLQRKQHLADAINHTEIDNLQFHYDKREKAGHHSLYSPPSFHGYDHIGKGRDYR